MTSNCATQRPAPLRAAHLPAPLMRATIMNKNDDTTTTTTTTTTATTTTTTTNNNNNDDNITTSDNSEAVPCSSARAGWLGTRSGS